MPAAGAARTEHDCRDTDDGRIFRLQLDPVAVQLDLLVQVRRNERRRREVKRRRSESDGCERKQRSTGGYEREDRRMRPEMCSLSDLQACECHRCSLLDAASEVSSLNFRRWTMLRRVRPS